MKGSIDAAVNAVLGETEEVRKGRGLDIGDFNNPDSGAAIVGLDLEVSPASTSNDERSAILKVNWNLEDSYSLSKGLRKAADWIERVSSTSKYKDGELTVTLIQKD